MRNLPNTAAAPPCLNATDLARGRTNLARYFCLVGLLMLLIGAGPLPQTAPATPPLRSPVAPAPPPSATSPSPASAMDEPLRLIAEARQTYQAARDYTCMFIKQEQLRGKLQVEQVIAMKVRVQPFSVYMRWIGPKQLAGQEACYVAGRQNGMMRARTNGLLGAVGFVTISPSDPRAMEHSRHTIIEAGIGNLIERFSKGWDLERQLSRTYVRIAEYEYNKRRCIRCETIHPDNGGGHISFYRSIVYFDKELRLPIRVENYDWPRQGGNLDGDLLENYSYVDLRFNVGLGEESFSY